MINLKEIMKMAHKLAKTFTGNYQARLALALKLIWARIKKGGNKMKEMFNKVEMHYGDYKNNYENNRKGEYNAETKKIEVYVLKDEFLTEAALKLEKKLLEIQETSETVSEKMLAAKRYLKHNLSVEYGTDGNRINQRLKEIRTSRA